MDGGSCSTDGLATIISALSSVSRHPKPVLVPRNLASTNLDWRVEISPGIDGAASVADFSGLSLQFVCLTATYPSRPADRVLFVRKDNLASVSKSPALGASQIRYQLELLADHRQTLGVASTCFVPREALSPYSHLLMISKLDAAKVSHLIIAGGSG